MLSQSRREIAILGAIQKRIHEQIHKTDTKNKGKSDNFGYFKVGRALVKNQTLLSQYWKNWQKLFRILGALILFSFTVSLCREYYNTAKSYKIYEYPTVSQKIVSTKMLKIAEILKYINSEC